MSDELFAKIEAMQREIDHLKRKIAYYEEPLPPFDECNCAHRFSDEGLCVRCGADAEEWDAGCIEETLREMIEAHKDIGDAILLLKDAKYKGYLPGIELDSIGKVEAWLVKIQEMIGSTE